MAGSYLPVILLHGFYMGPQDMNAMIATIQNHHQGTSVFALDFFDYQASACSLLDQVPVVIEKIRAIKAQESFDKYHLIGFSQGGAISRAVIESFADHGVQTYISLAGVQNGFFSPLPSFMSNFLPLEWQNIPYTEISRKMYTPSAQMNRTFGSVCNAFHDPNDPDFFARGNLFFGKFNNLGVDMEGAPARKKNFVSVNSMHYFTSRDDGIVHPFESSIFGFYGVNATEVLDLTQLDIYQKDLFGLRTMIEENRLCVHQVDGVPHMNWVQAEDVIAQNIVPLLD